MSVDSIFFQSIQVSFDFVNGHRRKMHSTEGIFINHIILRKKKFHFNGVNIEQSNQSMAFKLLKQLGK